MLAGDGDKSMNSMLAGGSASMGCLLEGKPVADSQRIIQWCEVRWNRLLTWPPARLFVADGAQVRVPWLPNMSQCHNGVDVRNRREEVRERR